ncbi:hypothetical protein [Brevibacterium permense]|uniref:Uncharacterized protein n=1 Tax=Brevibacterium permense TaxID=234834 RepID=A0ABP4L4P1_9MICO|nr:hypothetical protein [Brevibacterium permense]
MGEENHTPAEAADSSKSGPENRDRPDETLRDPLVTEESGKALLPGKGMACVQGFHAIAVGAVEPGWGIDRGALAGIWRAGVSSGPSVIAWVRTPECAPSVPGPSIRCGRGIASKSESDRAASVTGHLTEWAASVQADPVSPADCGGPTGGLSIC